MRMALLASVASGQDPHDPAAPRGEGPGGAVSPGVISGMGTGTENPLVVLSSPAVVKELKLTDEQTAKVDKLARDAGDRARELFFAMSQGADPALLMARGQDLRKKCDKQVAAILEKEQRQRLEEIMLQLEGLLAVARPEVAGRLKLNRNQTQAVQATISDLQGLQRQLLVASRRQAMIAQAQGGGAGPGIGGPMQQVAATQDEQLKRESQRLREQAAGQVGRVLSSKQKEEFQALLGPKFDVKQVDPDLSKFAPDPSRAASKGVRKGAAKTKGKG